jgi:hypothetical protein
MVRQGILDDLNRRNEEMALAREARIKSLEDEVQRLHAARIPVRNILNEVVALFPSLVSLSVGQEAQVTAEAPDRLVVVASWKTIPPAAEQRRLEEFLRRRISAPSLRVVNVRAH